VNRFIQVVFKGYYLSYTPSIPDLPHREIAMEPMSGGMRRHIAVSDVKELRKLVTERVPKHLYYSTALYEHPDVEDMDAKGWIGADLVFDIDADHLPNCTEEDLVGCLSNAIDETMRLIDALNNELGLDNYRIFFSGRRGFHIHVENDELRKLGTRERRVLVEFLTARGLDKSAFELRMGRRKVSAWHVAQVGSLRRIASDDPSIKIDEVVTPDVHRLIRAPDSLHGKTGLRVVELDLSDLERGSEHVIRKAMWHKGRLRIVLLGKPPKTALTSKVEGSMGDVVELEFHDALFLILNGYADIYEGETRRVAKSRTVSRGASRPSS